MVIFRIEHKDPYKFEPITYWSTKETAQEFVKLHNLKSFKIIPIEIGMNTDLMPFFQVEFKLLNYEIIKTTFIGQKFNTQHLSEGVYTLDRNFNAVKYNYYGVTVSCNNKNDAINLATERLQKYLNETKTNN